MRIAALQTVATPDVERNLEIAARLIGEAAREGAALAALPEYFCLMGRRDEDKLLVAEAPGAGPIQAFLSAHFVHSAAAQKIFGEHGYRPVAEVGGDGVRLPDAPAALHHRRPRRLVGRQEGVLRPGHRFGDEDLRGSGYCHRVALPSRAPRASPSPARQGASAPCSAWAWP